MQQTPPLALSKARDRVAQTQSVAMAWYLIEVALRSVEASWYSIEVAVWRLETEAHRLGAEARSYAVPT